MKQSKPKTVIMFPFVCCSIVPSAKWHNISTCKWEVMMGRRNWWLIICCGWIIRLRGAHKGWLNFEVHSSRHFGGFLQISKVSFYRYEGISMDVGKSCLRGMVLRSLWMPMNIHFLWLQTWRQSSSYAIKLLLLVRASFITLWNVFLWLGASFRMCFGCAMKLYSAPNAFYITNRGFVLKCCKASGRLTAYEESEGMFYPGLPTPWFLKLFDGIVAL